jgi:hypothetical protein
MTDMQLAIVALSILGWVLEVSGIFIVALEFNLRFRRGRGADVVVDAGTTTFAMGSSGEHRVVVTSPNPTLAERVQQLEAAVAGLESESQRLIERAREDFDRSIRRSAEELRRDIGAEADQIRRTLSIDKGRANVAAVLIGFGALLSTAANVVGAFA